MSSTTSSLTTAMDAFKCSPFMSPWRRTSCPVTPPRDGRTNLKHFMMEQRPLLALKYPFLTPQQIKRKGKELWSKLSAKDKKANVAAPSLRLPTPPRERVCEEMGKHHFPFRLPHNEPLSMFSSPPVRSSRKSLPAFPSSPAGHQGAVMSQSSRRTSGIFNNDSDKMLVVRKPPPEKTYAEGTRWWPRSVIEHTECKQSGILKRSQNARKTTGDRRVSFAEANYSPDGTSVEGCRHGNDLQTNDQYMEKSPDSRRDRLKSLGSNVMNRRVSSDGNKKQPIGESSANRKINQPDWSKLKTAPEIEDGEGMSSDSDAEREFQLACLHRDAEPVLPHGGFATNCRQSKPRRRSCDERLMARKKPRPGKKPRRTGRKDKDGHLDSRVDDQNGTKVHYGEGDRYVTQRKTMHQRTMMSYQKDKKHTSHADAKQHVTNSITVYDMFDEADSEMIDFSQTKFSDYRENVKHTTQTTRRRTIACAGNRRQLFMQEDGHMSQPSRGEVGDHIAAKCDKLHAYQYRNMTAPKQAKTDDRRGFRTRDSVIQNMSSPSCYNLRSQKVDETQLTSTDRCEGWQDLGGKVASPKPYHELSHGRGRKQGVGYGKTRNNKPVHFAPPGVNVQNQERLMTPETSEEIVAATLTNVICAPRKRRAAEHDIPTGEKMKCRAEEIEGRLRTGKTLGNGGAEYRMDRVRKRLVASVGADEQRSQTKKQKIGAENTGNVCSRKPDKVAAKAGGKPDCTPTYTAVPRHKPYTRSSVRAHRALSPCDTDSGTQMTWESTEKHDGIPHRRSTVDERAENCVSSVSSQHKRRDLHRNNDSVKVAQRFKVGSDVGDSRQPQCVSTEIVARRETRRTQSPSSALQNITNQNPSDPTCTLSSPMKSDASSSHNPDESTNDSMSPFPYVSPLPSSNASSGVGTSFWSLISLNEQAKRLQTDFDDVMSSSEDEFPVPVKNDVLTRAVRSMQQLTAPPGGPNSPRRTSVLSPSVSGISELSQLSSLFESAMQTTSPEPKRLGKNPVGSTVSGKITTRELGSTTSPRGGARLGTSPMRKTARKTTRRELQPVRSLKMKPPKLELPRVKPSCASPPSTRLSTQGSLCDPPSTRLSTQGSLCDPPSTRLSTQGSLCDLFEDVKPGNQQFGNRRVVASLPAATAENLDELFSTGDRDIFL